MKQLFVILGNQLFNPKIIKNHGCNEIFMSEDFGFSSVTSSGGNKVTTSLGSGGATYVTVQHNIVFTFGSGNTATPLSIYDYHVSVTPNYTSANILYYGIQQQGYASFKVTVRVLWSGNFHNDPFKQGCLTNRSIMKNPYTKEKQTSWFWGNPDTLPLFYI